MKILVTGGAGFIGSHLCKRLVEENHAVICLDNLLTGQKSNIQELLTHPSFSFLDIDVTKPFKITDKIDAVFHLASPASPNHHSPISYHALPMETMLVNTVGTLALLNLCRDNNAKFLFASTSEVYGDPLEHPQKEEYNGNSSTTGPRSVYDEAKRFGETLSSHFVRTGLDSRIARIFNTYGPNMQLSDMRMIVSFIIQAVSEKPITVFGDGAQTRSLCFVSDTVDGLIRLMFYPNTKGAIINIGSPEEHTVNEYAQIIKDLTGSKSEIVHQESLPQDDPRKRQPDIMKAKKLLQWEPQVGLEDGLVKMIAYIKNINRLKD